MSSSLESGLHEAAGVIARARELWNMTRFFGVNGAERFSSFEAADVLRMSQPGSLVNGFARDGRALLILGVKGGRGVREETLSVLNPDRLGLKPGVRYRLIDLRNKRYFARNRTAADLSRIPARLVDDEPLILLLEPERTGPQLVYFAGVDGATEDGPLDLVGLIDSFRQPATRVPSEKRDRQSQDVAEGGFNQPRLYPAGGNRALIVCCQ
jgi:hypothetical protein